VELVLQAGAMGRDSDIFVLDMGTPVKIADLARNLIRLSGLTPDEDIRIDYTGLRPGEKLYEELIAEGETLTPTNVPKLNRLRCDVPALAVPRDFIGIGRDERMCERLHRGVPESTGRRESTQSASRVLFRRAHGDAASWRLDCNLINPEWDTGERKRQLRRTLAPERTRNMKKILCVDDESTVLEMLDFVLSQCGYAVFTANNGREAIEIARREGIRVFLLDLHMPGMDGVTLCQRLRENDSVAAIYAVSAYTGFWTPQQLKTIGFDGILNKPCALDRLKEICGAAFEQLNGKSDLPMGEQLRQKSACRCGSHRQEV